MLLGGAMLSCEDTLEVESKSSLDESVIFSNYSLAEGAVAGVIHAFGEQNSYRGRFLVHYGLNNDTEVTHSLRDINDDKARLANYNTNVNNGQMNSEKNVWADHYQAIERANVAIRGLRNYGNVENDASMAQLLGEVLTLRAVVYNDLLRAWGDVPARFDPIDSETIYLPRADRDIIFKQLLEDLEEATELIPWPNGNTITQSTERINKAFVKGLRARLALAAGGYGQRPDGIRRSNDPELAPEKMYAIAKTECLEVINSETAELESFEGVFRSLHREDYVAGKEILWEIPFSSSRGRVLYDLAVPHNNADKYTEQPKGGANGPNPAIFYDYDVDDVRRDVSIVPYEWTDGIQEPSGLHKLYFGKYRYEWLFEEGKRRVVGVNDDGLNFVYMRYSDILLMAAEAINELDGPGAAAPYLREVRERAFPDNPEKVESFMVAATASKEAFFDAIVDERALEFVGEKLRKADLIRWNLLGAKLAESAEKLQMLEARQGKYADLPLKIYYQTSEDGETLDIYGLNYGDTDAEGAALGYIEEKEWKLNGSEETVMYWDALYTADPDAKQYWPIWQVFIESSNGQLTNDGYGYNE